MTQTEQLTATIAKYEREQSQLQTDLTALEAMSVCDTARDALRRQLVKGYRR